MKTGEKLGKREVAANIIKELQQFAKLYSIDSLFVVGGYCRSLLMKDSDEINDIDIASAYPQHTIRLCGLFASEVLKTTPNFHHRSGTGFIEYKGIKIEFQGGSSNSYMYNTDVIQWMRQEGIRNTPLLNNIYGRDFTINSIIMSLKDSQFYDLTGRAVSDLQRKYIKPLIPAKMLVKYNPIVVLRAIRFANKYDFSIDPELRKAMLNQKHNLKKTYSIKRLTKEIDSILSTDTKEALRDLQRYDLLGLVMPKQLEKYIEDFEK